MQAVPKVRDGVESVRPVFLESVPSVLDFSAAVLVGRERQIFLGSSFQAPFFALLLTQVSMNAMPIQPSSMLAYFEPSQANGLPACHLRTSASKQRCSRAY